MIQHSYVNHNPHLPLGLGSCRYGGAVGVTFPEFGADNSGDRSSIPSEAIISVDQHGTTAAAAANGGGLRPLLWRGAVRLWARGRAVERRSQRRKRGGWEIAAGPDGISLPSYPPFCSHCQCCLLLVPSLLIWPCEDVFAYNRENVHFPSWSPRSSVILGDSVWQAVLA